ncbi:signal peptide peptidase SppA [Arcticibacter tournemirensis]|uniref:Signal peptide peptidase SppA n=1 Tax=Arcticibacter tournemirensis TaxID=699437 RepID=A0A4Q0MCZ8_9SPHI|nr:signal peptide peptidase SppA [Arcticibacter tournemirensis]RXF71085.1 signal peptide peptidase SppA [Arcticibacter tournemirensis]
MKGFFKIVFASMVGFILSAIVLGILFIAIVVGIVSATDGEKVTVSPNSVIHMSLNDQIVERTSKSPFDELELTGLQTNKNMGLNDILLALKRAQTDDNIKGIYLDVSGVQAGMATVEEIRNALIDFKKSKKFILAYSEVYTQGAYYLASVADKVYINPEGILEFTGFSSQVTFFKGTMEKLEIEPQIIKVGTYKSAVEPFILDKMSDANRQQVTSFVGSMYDHFLTRISAARSISKDSLFAIANQLKVRNASDAVKLKLVDGLRYKDQVIDELKKRTGTDKKDDVKAVSLAGYIKNNKAEDGDINNRIAVVYASGEITGGEGDDETIGSERISRTIRKVRTDDKIKAVVFRVNSPGGSALASDVIWREIALTRKVKPVIVSMGDVAASGGYYIACAADSIFAEPNTITGSIGVFGIIPNMQKFFNNKLGITFDGVKTAEHADLGTVTRPLTDAERLIIQAEVNRIYGTFTKRVSDGRKKTQEYINQIGQGRVWSGSEALKNGLVDRLGDIDDAVVSAAKMAKLTDYKLVSYPTQKDPLESIFNTGEDKLKEHFTKMQLGEQYQYYKQLKDGLRFTGIQARLPYNITIK